MSGERQDLDPSAQVAAELRARLRSMASDQLIELCAQLLATYVVEGVLPLGVAGESTELAADAAGEESFAQMLKRLKAAKRDPVLERFTSTARTSPFASTDRACLPITEYRRPVGPPAGPGVSVQFVRRESVPGAAGSIYNDRCTSPTRRRRRGPPVRRRSRSGPSRNGPARAARAAATLRPVRRSRKSNPERPVLAHRAGVVPRCALERDRLRGRDASGSPRTAR